MLKQTIRTRFTHSKSPKIIALKFFFVTGTKKLTGLCVILLDRDALLAPKSPPYELFHSATHTPTCQSRLLQQLPPALLVAKVAG